MNAAQLIAWLETQAAAVAYGEITLKIVLHDSQIRNIEKNICIREKPEASA